MKGLLNVDIEILLNTIIILIIRKESAKAVDLILFIQDNLEDKPPKVVNGGL